MSRRPVARRACLSCREKKIKCDGEPISTILSIDGSNRVIPQDTRRCSNCKILGTDCVFVQSNRGGRRKKRGLEEEDSDPKSKPTPYQGYKFAGMVNEYDPKQPVDHPSQYDTSMHATHPSRCGLFQGSQDMKSFVGHVKIPPLYNRAAPSMAPILTSPNMGTILPPSQQHYTPWQPNIPWNGGPNWNSYGHKAPPTIKIHPTENTFQVDNVSNTITPITPTNPPPYAGSNFQKYPNQQPLYRNSILPMGYQNPNVYNPVLPLLELKPISPQMQRPILPITERSRLSNASSYFSDSIDRTDMAEKNDERLKRKGSIFNPTSPAEIRSKEPVLEDKNHIASIHTNAELSDSSESLPFEDCELAQHSLPPWKTLTAVIDTYYTIVHPNHQFLPAKKMLIKNISIKFDSAILHSIIANVVLLGESITAKFQINSSVDYWIDLAYENFETLNGLGALASYSLLYQVPLIRLNREKNPEFTKLISQVISQASYLQVYNKSKNFSYGLTTRQFYEREFIVQMLWSFFVNQRVLGQNSDDLQDQLILPLDNVEYCLLKFVPDEKRIRDIKTVPCVDTHSVLYACVIFDSVRPKLAAKNFDAKDRQTWKNDYRTYFDYMRDRHLTVENDVMVVNTSYLKANLINKTGDILQLVYLAGDLMPLKPLTQVEDELVLVPLIRNIGELKISDYSTLLDTESVSKWLYLVELTHVAFETHKLFEPTEDDRIIAMGPTSVDDPTGWSRNKALQTTITDAWIKYPDLALNTACELISVIVNLLILSCNIKMEELALEELKVTVDKSTKTFESIAIDSSFESQFNSTILLKKFKALSHFIRIKLISAPSRVHNTTIENLEEILSLLVKCMDAQ